MRAIKIEYEIGLGLVLERGQKQGQRQLICATIWCIDIAHLYVFSGLVYTQLSVK